MTAASHLPVVFAHGWGFDATVWDAVRARLGDAPVWTAEAGYFGLPERDVASAAHGFDAYVVVGHSLGAMRCLTEHGPGCRGLLLVNGFPRFAAAPDFPEGVPARLIDRMLARLAADPAAVVSDFRRRCGAPSGAAGTTYAQEALAAGLLHLRDGDARTALEHCSLPLRVLAGETDAIVPPALTRAAFTGREMSLRWLAGGEHLLPLTHPDWCAAQLADFLAEIGHTSGGRMRRGEG